MKTGIVATILMLVLAQTASAEGQSVPLKCFVDYGGLSALDQIELQQGTPYEQYYSFANEVEKLGAKPAREKNGKIQLMVMARRDQYKIYVDFYDRIPGRMLNYEFLQKLFSLEQTLPEELPKHFSMNLSGPHNSAFRCYAD